LRCCNAHGFLSDNFALSTGELASPASDATAEAKHGHRFAVAVLLSPSGC